MLHRYFFFFSSRRRHTRSTRDWSSDVCSSDLYGEMTILQQIASAGRGQYLAADNFANLEANIGQVMKAIVTNATSFSSAAVATVQTHGYTSAFIPRFNPSGGA